MEMQYCTRRPIIGVCSSLGVQLIVILSFVFFPLLQNIHSVAFLCLGEIVHDGRVLEDCAIVEGLFVN